MSTSNSGRYFAPTETPLDAKQFEDINTEILRIQQIVTKNPNLLYSDILGYTMRLTYLRKEARALNQKFRLNREVN